MLDTSSAIAFVDEEHDAHAATVEALSGLRLGLAGHAWYEAYSVLTRMPAGRRRSPAVVHRLLERDFPESRFLDAEATAALRAELTRSGISGGAIYDALVGAVARLHDLPLITGDRRALRTYDALGIRVRLIEEPST